MMDQEQKNAMQKLAQQISALPPEIQQAIKLFALGAEAASRAAKETA